MGFFGDNRKELAADADERAAKHDKEARAAAAEAAKYRKMLKEGSGDPAADRYMIRLAERDRRIAEVNARDERDSAKRLRRLW